MFSKLVKFSKAAVWIGGLLSLVVACVYFFYKKKKRGGRMSLKEAFDDADTSKLNEEQLEKFNNMKSMML